MATSKVDLNEIKSLALGAPYDGEKLLKSLRDICDTVCHKHFREHIGDHDLYDAAICRVTHLLCKGVVDFRYPASKCFSYLYTTVRNVIGNCLKSQVREVAVTEVYSTGKSISGESIAHFRLAVRKASKTIVRRLSELDMCEESYGGLVWRASFYRAVFEEGSI